jgi:membrane-associated protein
MFSDFFEYLESASTSPWFYLVIFAVAMFDSVIPIVPSETTVILGGIAAGQGHLFIVAVIFVGALGAFIGDNIAYQLGLRASDFLRRTLFKSEAGAERLQKAADQIEKRGGPLLITARFIPGGRTALTCSSGITRQPIDWFLKWDAVATVLWATYAGGLGYIFGDQFADDHTKAFYLAFGAALGITAVIEIIRWVRERNKDHSVV